MANSKTKRTLFFFGTCLCLASGASRPLSRASCAHCTRTQKKNIERSSAYRSLPVRCVVLIFLVLLFVLGGASRPLLHEHILRPRYHFKQGALFWGIRPFRQADQGWHIPMPPPGFRTDLPENPLLILQAESPALQETLWERDRVAGFEVYYLTRDAMPPYTEF